MRNVMGSMLVLAAVAAPATAQQDAGHDMQHAAAPTEGVRAELVADIDQLEQKYLGLARAMTAHFSWRPQEGVRSVGEVFGHVANANFMFPSLVGLERGMEGQNYEQADQATILEGLEHSFMHARRAIADVPDAELDTRVSMFGRDATKRQVLWTMVGHMHEHLGQAIAYARSNGVTPPWSAANE